MKDELYLCIVVVKLEADNYDCWPTLVSLKHVVPGTGDFDSLEDYLINQAQEMMESQGKDYINITVDYTKLTPEMIKAGGLDDFIKLD